MSEEDDELDDDDLGGEDGDLITPDRAIDDQFDVETLDEFDEDDFDEDFDDDFEEEILGEYDLEDDQYGEDFDDQFGHLTDPSKAAPKRGGSTGKSAPEKPAGKKEPEKKPKKKKGE